jgi:hypothetical protein
MFNGLYSAIAYPYFMVNDFPSIDDPETIILIMSETIFLIDIILNFFKQDLDEEGKSKFESLKTVAFKYFHN